MSLYQFSPLDTEQVTEPIERSIPVAIRHKNNHSSISWKRFSRTGKQVEIELCMKVPAFKY